MTEEMPREFVRGDSIRLVVTHACQERCDFCHNEGNTDYSPGNIDTDKSVAFALQAREAFGIPIVHLTGGEPTLSPETPELIRKLKAENFTVQMTTNGDWNPELLGKLADAGLDSLVFSLHAVTAEDFYKVQGMGQMKRNIEWCRTMMDRKFSNIREAKGRMNIKINTVLINAEVTGRVLDFAIDEGIPIRLMRNLNLVSQSESAIQQILQERDLVPIKEQVALSDSSGASTLYGFADKSRGEVSVKVKRFGDIYLESICGGCALRDTDNCRERFYGIRLEQDPKTRSMQARLCIDRDDAVVPVENFFTSAHADALAFNYARQ